VQQTRGAGAAPAASGHEAAATAAGRAFAHRTGSIAAGPAAPVGAQCAPLPDEEIEKLKRRGSRPVASKAKPRPRPSGPTAEYDVPTHRLFRWQGSPAPPEHVQQHGTTPADRAKAQHYGEKYGPKDAPHKWTAGHEKPASHTPPGERPWMRAQAESENKAGGPDIGKLNKVRRQDPTHRDPESPSYTRPTKPRYGSKAYEAQKAARAQGTPDPAPKVDAPVPAPPDPAPKIDPPHPSAGAPDVHAPIPKGSAGPAAGFAERLAGKLGPLAVVGDILLVHQVAEEIEWHHSPADPKWGLERTDMFFETWYRSDLHSGTWYTKGATEWA
jgi:hypothetical protein